MNATTPTLIFCDGACTGNPGPGGWGVIVATQDWVKEQGGGTEHTTNNRMELTAAIEALSLVTSPRAMVFTDSTYLIRGIEQWIHRWRNTGWKNAQGGDVANKDLWERLAEEVAKRQVRFYYVQGHAGIPGNERVDAIAVAFATKKPVTLYEGPASHYSVSLSVPDSKTPARKKEPVYLSLLDGKLLRHRTWAECEARVKGKAGAKYKKVSSDAEETATLTAWGIKLPPKE